MTSLKHISIAAAFLAVTLISTSANSADTVDKLMNQHPGVQAKANDLAKARGMFYEPPAPPRPRPGQGQLPPFIGLRYKILLLGPDGYTREVPETFPFVSGQRFRLVFQPNINGFLYIFHKGSNSKGMRLFPDPRINEGRNRVNKFEEVMVPAQGWFRFDNQTGMEDLYVFVTPRPLDAFNNLQYGSDGALPQGGWQQVTAATSDMQRPRPDAARGDRPPRDRAVKGSDAKPDKAPAAKKEGSAKEGSAAKEAKDKNIVFEPEGAPPVTYTPPVTEPDNWALNTPAPSYAVQQAPMLIHHIRMQHHAR